MDGIHSVYLEIYLNLQRNKYENPYYIHFLKVLKIRQSIIDKFPQYKLHYFEIHFFSSNKIAVTMLSVNEHSKSFWNQRP